MDPKANKPIEELLADVSKQLVQVGDDVKATADKANKEIKNLGTMTAETKETADKVLAEQGHLTKRMDELEQQAARPSGQAPEKIKSLGEQTVASEAVQNFMKQGVNGAVKFTVNAAITSLTTDADGSAGDAVAPDRQLGIVGLPQRRMTIRDLIMPGKTSSNAVEYVKQTGFTNNAEIQATEGTTKGSSSIKLDLVSSPVVTIAHTMDASKQILDDAPMLTSFIDGQLRYGLALKEEAQLLNGSGAGGNLNGIYTQATAFSNPSALHTSPNMIDTIRLALLQATLAEYNADGIVLNPVDWTNIELTKDGQSNYIFANPYGVIAPMLWGRPVVETQAQAVDEYLVGAFKLAAQIFDREQVNVQISLENNDNFETNMVSLRGEERLALAVMRPEAFIKGDFGNVA